MTGQEALDAVRSEAGFDITEARAKQVIDQRVQEAVARAKWAMEEVTVSSTVADQRLYTLPSDVVDAERIWVVSASDSGITEYDRKSPRDLMGLRSGRLRRTGTGGFFAPNFSSTGVAQVELYPAPENTGDTIYAYAAVQAADISDWTQEVTVVPVQFHERILVDGPVASLLARIDERVAEADRFEGRFEDAVIKLERHKNSRLGSGPQRAAVVGYDA